jgi:hypothetical protein
MFPVTSSERNAASNAAMHAGCACTAAESSALWWSAGQNMCRQYTQLLWAGSTTQQYRQSGAQQMEVHCQHTIINRTLQSALGM